METIQSHCLTARLPDCLTAQLPNCPTARLPDCPTAQLPDCPTARLPDCPTARLPDCLQNPNLCKKDISICNNHGDAMAKAQVRKIKVFPASETSWIR